MAEARPPGNRSPSLPIWDDGQLVPAEARLAGPVTGSRDAVGCYTSACVRGGRAASDPCADWESRHVDRLRRDTATLGLGHLRAELIPRAFRELAAAAFGAGDGIVRLEAHASANGTVRLLGVPRTLGPDSSVWKASISEVRHPGAHAWSRVKLCSEPSLAQARGLRRRAGVDEALLVDAAGYVIEGTRSNLVVVDSSGAALTPDLARGGVHGIAYEVLCERVPELQHRNIPAIQLRDARELIAINSVRGARAIVTLDGIRIGTGRVGPWAKRLAKILTTD